MFCLKNPLLWLRFTTVYSHNKESTNHLGKNDGPYFIAYVLDNSRNLVNIIWC